MDQQFRLKWNNHCNTLLQVFGTLLKTETLVDCTIGADGQYLKAHKVVVSACSPYFQSLFTEHFDKHPIIILKDIKFTELQSMIDYMYEGEVNISQDQLPSFLKAAASIQLKGLTQNAKSEPPMVETPPSSHHNKPLPQLNTSRSSSGGIISNGQNHPTSLLNVELEEGQLRKKRKMEPQGGGGGGGPPSSASSSPSLVPDLVVPNVILDVPSENNNGAGAGNMMNNGAAGVAPGAAGGGGGGADSLKKEPSEYSGRSEDEEEDGMSHDGWGDHSNDGDNNSTMSGDRTGSLSHTPGSGGGNRAVGGPGALPGGPDLSNVDENNQGRLTRRFKTTITKSNEAKTHYLVHSRNSRPLRFCCAHVSRWHG